MESQTTVQPEGRSQRERIWAALAVAVISISFAAALFIQAEPTHPLAKAGIRLAFAGVLLAPWVARAWKNGRLRRRFVLHGALGGVFYAIHFGAWVSSLEGTSITASVTLVTATPLLLAMWGLLSGQDRPQKRHWLAIVLALIGVSIVTFHDAGQGQASVVANVMALLGAAGMAGYLLTARRLGDSVDVWAFSGIATGVGALVLGCVALAADIPFQAGSTEALGYLLLAALVPQLIGHSALTWVLRFRSPTLVGIATVGEPVGATVVGYVWLGLGVDVFTMLGCALTLLAVLVAIYEPRSRPAELSGPKGNVDGR